MKKLRIAPGAFTIAFACAYALVFWMNWPLFLYYPLHSDFNWGRQALPGVGPVMVWYGLMSSAAIIAVLAAICVPERAVDSLFRNYLWLFPCATMLVCVFLLRRLFA